MTPGKGDFPQKLLWSPPVAPLLERFFELSPSFMMVVDASGEIRAINPALVRALGYDSPAPLLGHSVTELLHPEDIARSAAARSRVLGGERVIDEERRLRRQDGTWLLTSWRATGEDGLVYSVGVDLTQSRRVERLNAQAQALAKVGGFERDLLRDERHWTPQTHEILGIESTAAIGPEAILRRLEPEDQRPLIEAEAESRRTGQPVALTVRLNRSPGDQRWLRVVLQSEARDGMTVRVVGALQDITALKEAEDAAAQSEARYRALYERTPAMLHSIDREGRLLSVSDRWLQTLGYERAEVLGRRSVEFLTEASRTYAQHHVLPEFLRTGRCDDVEYQMLTKDGRVLDVLLSATSERGPDGTVEHSLAVLNDVTEKKKATQALQAALVEKEVLLKEVHHRVKNNLQIITSLLNIQAQRIDDPRVRATLIDAQSRVRAMAQVHERLYQSPDLARIDFGRYLSDLLAELRRAVHVPGVEVQGRSADVALSVETAIPCGLIVNELVVNALKHAFPGGGRGRVQVDLQPEGELICLSVEDDGQGVGALGPSPGLGLHLVERLTGQLGGTLSRGGPPGTSYQVRFPATPRRTP